jgi:hypothetical protein
MTQFANYRDSFPNARLTRSQAGVLEVALHTKGDTLVFNGHTHEQFVELFHAIGGLALEGISAAQVAHSAAVSR